MQTEDFIKRVEQTGPDGDPHAAYKTALVTVELLCARLPKQEAKNLASQLAEELADAATAGAERSDLSERPVSLGDFYNAVAERAGLQYNIATGYARATVQTLKQALSDGELSDVALELPPELSELIAE